MIIDYIRHKMHQRNQTLRNQQADELEFSLRKTFNDVLKQDDQTALIIDCMVRIFAAEVRKDGFKNLEIYAQGQPYKDDKGNSHDVGGAVLNHMKQKGVLKP